MPSSLSSSGPAVIVVGGGPAGATAARTLAMAGVRVTLLDRASFPRNKPCGGAISARALKRFPHLERALSRIPVHRLSRLHLEGPKRRSTVVESDVPAALMIRRIEFDHLLVALAIEAGVEVVTGADIVQAVALPECVRLTARDGRRFEAPLVVAADGVHSVVARRLGINPGWPAASIALDMMEETPREVMKDADPSLLWVAYGYDARGADSGDAPIEGYSYVFPKRDHVNVGVGYVLDQYRRDVDARPYDVQARFVEHLRERGVVDGRSVRRNFTPFLIPVGGPLRRPGRGRVLLAGDAGGFVNGFTAEGIYYAMVSGELAGQAVVASLADPSRLAGRYRRSCAREMGAELRDSVSIRRYLFSHPRRIAAVIEGARRQPETTRRVLDFAIGRLGYFALRRTLVAQAPRLAATLVWNRVREMLAPGPARRPLLERDASADRLVV